MKTQGRRGSPRKLKKVGMNSSDTAQIYFDDVRVPQRYRIGEEGMGFTYQMQQFQEERLWARGRLAQSIEIIEETIDYLRERQAFGKPLLDNQFIYFKLAELKTEVEAARRAVPPRRRAVRRRQGRDAARLDGQAQGRAPGARGRRLAACSSGAAWATSRRRRVNRVWRDARLGSIGGGADEVMLRIIAKTMGILPGREGTACNRRGGPADPTTFDTLLIANRGEIACAIIRTARAHGLSHRGRVFATPTATRCTCARRPRGAHRRGASRGVLPRSTPIIDGGQRAGADAVHPGYGFLSENADFARRLRRRPGSCSSGPSPAAIAAHGQQVGAPSD